MSERPRFSEQLNQPEVIQLDQEFFPYQSVKPIDGMYTVYHKPYKLLLPIPNYYLLIGFTSYLPESADLDPLALKPFGIGYTIDRRDFDLESRKDKLASLSPATSLDPQAPLGLSVSIDQRELVQAKMARTRKMGLTRIRTTQINQDIKVLLASLRLSVSANGKYEGRIHEWDFEKKRKYFNIYGLSFQEFYPADADQLVGDSPFTRISHYPDDLRVGTGHPIRLPNNKALLDEVGLKFYFDREQTQQQRFQEE